jgi:hypothetical protein
MRGESEGTQTISAKEKTLEGIRTQESYVLALV